MEALPRWRQKLFAKKNLFTKPAAGLTVLCAIFVTPAALAHWQLNNQQSQLNFTTIKADNVAENHRFEQLSGSINDAGEVLLSIDVASVNTNIPIRDERLRDLLFSAVDFPQATFTTQIEPDALQGLPIGGSKVVEIKGTLSIRDQEIKLSSKVLATKVNSRALLVNTLSPILIDAGAFGLTEAVAELREIAGLPSISLAVPVTFTLTFNG